MNNRLKGTMCYLCGAMDRVPDGGEGWRRMITPVLRDIGVGVLDPCNKPTKFAEENAEFRKEVEILKLSSDKISRPYFLNNKITVFLDKVFIT